MERDRDQELDQPQSRRRPARPGVDGEDRAEEQQTDGQEMDQHQLVTEMGTHGNVQQIGEVEPEQADHESGHRESGV